MESLVLILGTFDAKGALDRSTSRIADVSFNVTKSHQLNLLGRTSIASLDINVRKLIQEAGVNTCCEDLGLLAIAEDSLDMALQRARQQLCTEDPKLFEPEMGCLKDAELDIRFKPEAQPSFCKPRTVPFAIMEDLHNAYDAGIKKAIWVPTKFNAYETPGLPITKALLPGQHKAKLRVCRDYSVTDQAPVGEASPSNTAAREFDAEAEWWLLFHKGRPGRRLLYNQIKLTPESQKRLPLSTHRGVLLQTRLPYWISSAPGSFQEIMDQLTSNLRGVAVYLDDILVRGATAKEHLRNLLALLQCLQSVAICNLKCSFAQSSVEYLGHTMSRDGISKGRKVDTVAKMPQPTNSATLRSFLGSVQLYGKLKFIPSLSTQTEPLTRLLGKTRLGSGVPSSKLPLNASKTYYAQMWCLLTSIRNSGSAFPVTKWKVLAVTLQRLELEWCCVISTKMALNVQ